MNPQDTYTRLWQSLLTLYDDREARAIVRLVLGTKFNMTLTDIVTGGADRLDDAARTWLSQAMDMLQQGEPVQYVLGETDFCGRRFHVEHGVLIPRPETALLCERITADHNRAYCALQPPEPIRVLDIGTGSGCIAVTLALDLDNSDVTAWDISPDALLVARGNAHALGAQLNLQLHDILQPAETLPYADSEGGWFDLIVSNPPYIAEHEKAGMRPNVLGHEPTLALFVPDDDPLRFYRAIARYARRALKCDGELYFEINPLYAARLTAMLSQEGFAMVQTFADQFGKQRFAKATWNGLSCNEA